MDTPSKYVYLDNAATASDLDYHIPDNFANPNSTHDAGRDSFAALEAAREKLAQLIGCKRPHEVVFTSGATESNNMAIFGIARAVAKKNFSNISSFTTYQTENLQRQKSKIATPLLNKPKVLVSSVEHESALMPALQLKNEGFIVEKIPVDNFGQINLERYNDMLTSNTVLVIIQHANTETGVVQNIYNLAKIAHSVGAYFFSDMVGTFGKFPLNVTCVDAASFSGHKIGAPKGIGLLYLKNKTPFVPLMFGSGQERGLRPGTQSVALALSLKAAAQYSYEQMTLGSMQNLKEYLFNQINDIEGVDITTPNAELPNIVNLTFSNFYSEDLVLHYSKYGIIVSGGPACSSIEKNPSHVLTAMRIPKKKLEGSLRVSFNYKTKKSDIDKFINATKDLLKLSI